MNIEEFKKKYFSSFKLDGVNEDNSSVENWIIGLDDDEERYMFFSSSNDYSDSSFVKDKRNYSLSVKYGCFLKTNNEEIVKIYFYRIVTDDILFKTKIDKIAVEPNDNEFIKKLNKIKFSEEGSFDEFDNLFDRTHLVNEFKLLYRRTKNYLLDEKYDLIKGINTKKEKEEYVDLILTRFLFLWFLQKKEGKLLDNNENYLIDKFLEHKNNFYINFLEEFFFTSLCYADSNSKKRNLISKIGYVPYLNSGLFLKNKIEESCPIEIDDKAFYIDEETTYGLKNTKTYTGPYPIFNVFDSRDWTNLSDKVLGDIFEELMNTDERKGTGAFYTPSVITKYMSKNTIEPYLLNILEKNGYRYSSFEDLFNNYDNKAGNILYENLKIITIVDNACGSGHYLADASEYLVSIWNRLKEKHFNENIKAIDKEGKIINKKVCDCSSKDFAYHIIVNNIYGVDLNEEAIQIAKLRLFLFMADKFESIDDVIPLPNITFNVEYGNSLIGFTEIKNTQYHLSGFVFDDNLSNILTKYLDSIKSIKETEFTISELRYFMLNKKFREGEVAKNFFKIRNELINVFKNLHNPDEAVVLRDFIIEITNYFNNKLNHIFLTSYFDNTNISIDELEEKNPFHWVMRFSDVFEKGGFDIVIGNPPYVRQELIKEDKIYFEQIFNEIYDGIADLSTYFIYRSIQILKENGINSYIITNKWLRANYGVNIRKFLKNNTKILQLLDFNSIKVFVGATVDVIIYFISKEKNNNSSIKVCNNFEDLKYIFKLDNVNSLNSKINKNSFIMKQEYLKSSIWNLVDENITKLKLILESKGKKIKDWDIKINRGIITGLNEAFIIDKKTRDNLISSNKDNKKILNKLIRGRDISKFNIQYNDLYLITTKNGINVKEDYPSIYDFLNEFNTNSISSEKPNGALADRLDKGNHWTNLRNCAYYDDFGKYKIMYPELISDFQIIFDVNSFYSNNSIHFMTSPSLGKKLKYFYLIFVSRVVFNFYKKSIAPLIGKKGYKYNKVFVENIPIIEIDNTKPFEIIADYLLFTNQWVHENEKNQSKDYYKLREISQFFDEVANALVYELYLKEELEKDNLYYDLLKEIELRLEEIDFDNWSKELFKDKEERDFNELKEIENKNISTLFNVYRNLDVKNILADVEEMKTNNYVKIIEESGK